MQTYVSIYIWIYMCEYKLQCIICSDIHMSHNDNSRNVSHTFLIDHNLSGPGRSHAQAAKRHLLLISRPPARWATGFSGDLQHNYLLLYIMFCFCNNCTIVLEINILLLLLLLYHLYKLILFNKTYYYLVFQIVPFHFHILSRVWVYYSILIVYAHSP